jgi:hypothetical protein
MANKMALIKPRSAWIICRTSEISLAPSKRARLAIPMAARAPTTALFPERISDQRRYVPDEKAVARWAAWYEGLPEDLRDAFDERGRSAFEEHV